MIEKVDYQRVWEAAYAAAFVADFEQLSDRVKEQPYYKFDDIARRVTGVRAEAIANLAVDRLRESRGETVEVKNV